MARAGYDPEQSIVVLEALDAQSASNPAPPAFLSTPPSHPERILQLMDAMPKARKEREQSATARGPVIFK